MKNIKQKVFNCIQSLIDRQDLIVTEDTILLGQGSVLDSMKLVELCLAMEDLASEFGKTFDWTSDSAMSRSRSMFKTAGSIADEFASQIGVVE